jgi:hypothetical protein
MPQAIVMGPMTTKHNNASKSPKRAGMAVEAASATAKVRTAATAMAVVAAGDKRELETVAFRASDRYVLYLLLLFYF